MAEQESGTPEWVLTGDPPPAPGSVPVIGRTKRCDRNWGHEPHDSHDWDEVWCPGWPERPDDEPLSLPWRAFVDGYVQQNPRNPLPRCGRCGLAIGVTESQVDGCHKNCPLSDQDAETIRALIAEPADERRQREDADRHALRQQVHNATETIIGLQRELAEIRRAASEAWRLASEDHATDMCGECGRLGSDAADAAEDALYRRILGPAHVEVIGQ